MTEHTDQTPAIEAVEHPDARDYRNRAERAEAECAELRAKLDAAMIEGARRMQEAAVKVAEWAHMVPPDGGSPSDEEKEVADEAARRIRALSPQAIVEDSHD